MRTDAKYSWGWVMSIWKKWYGSHTRATNFSMAISGLSADEIQWFLRENSNLWDIFKTLVKRLEFLVEKLGPEDFEAKGKETTQHMLSTFGLKSGRITWKEGESALTALESFITLKERGILGVSAPARRSRAKQKRPYSSPKEYYIR